MGPMVSERRPRTAYLTQSGGYLPLPAFPARDRADRGDDDASASRERPAERVRAAAGRGALRARTRSEAPGSVSVRFDTARALDGLTAVSRRVLAPGRRRARALALLVSRPSFFCRCFSDMPYWHATRMPQRAVSSIRFDPLRCLFRSRTRP